MTPVNSTSHQILRLFQPESSEVFRVRPLLQLGGPERRELRQPGHDLPVRGLRHPRQRVPGLQRLHLRVRTDR